MAGIVGRGLTFNLPNFVGPLFQLTPSDTPFLSAIGGLTGGTSTNATEFQWQGFDLRDASQRTRLEGADAPDAENRVRKSFDNILQIHQETIDVSYTKQAAVGQYAGLNITGSNPVVDEIDFQTQAMLKQVARDVEYSFIQGAYQKPVDNTTPRKTRGVLEAIATNVITNASPTALTEDMILDLMQMVWDNGGIHESETATIMLNSWQRRQLTRIFITEKNYQERTRTVGGVSVSTIMTDFGELNVMLNRNMPQDAIAVVSLEECEPVFLEIPSKGHFFLEPLAQVGAAFRFQLYGEIGLKYGSEISHGKITGLEVQ